MAAADVISVLKILLEGASELSYVKEVLLGVREKMTLFPCLIIEPLSLTESDDTYARQVLTMCVSVIGYIHCTNKDKQIAGDADTKGILDFENDLKKALDSNRTLSGAAIDTRITETVYEFAEYPLRSFALRLEVIFRQIAGTR